ncbi:nucleotide sugar dehydrogenase [Alkalibacillus sp. S2W]|uniref:nucleotide sugar dehydrogenase n=1 Tax=Alkalibacillus sp. S2W TaxID=3386553 RepID=UPI00398D2E0F
MLFEKLINRNESLSVIGLGYVGLPIAVAFADEVDVIGVDINQTKIDQYRSGIDPTKEVGDEKIQETSMEFTDDESKIKDAKFHIVSVPTPIKHDKTPELSPIEGASKTIGRNLTHGSIVVYESTVYPGVTEDVCIPILEKESGLKCGVDFKVGYSPERINPGDNVNTLEKIVKIVSAIDNDTLDEIAKIYELVIDAGVHKATSIKVAEAAKVVENSQRDINIAFMNELAMVFDRMGIDSTDVVDAMNTKWNALGFTPGLVGGHCIGVDPYYFIYEAEKLGYHSQIVLSGRKINDSMGEFVADAIIKKLIKTNKVVKQAKVAILGLTFKENTPDTRNSKVIDIVNGLNDYGIKPVVVDPVANPDEVYNEYGIELTSMEQLTNLDCIVLAVAHDQFKAMGLTEFDRFFANVSNENKVLIDVKSVMEREPIEAEGYEYWRL